MFIRKFTSQNKASGKTYHEFCLVESVRDKEKPTPRQKRILSLGKDFDLAPEKWAIFCRRIESILAGKHNEEPLPDDIETLAQDCANAITTGKKKLHPAPVAEAPECRYVELAFQGMAWPRSVGVEHAALVILDWLDFGNILEAAGLNPIQRACALACIIGRMLQLSDERIILKWAQEESALGELLGVKFERIRVSRFYQVLDQLAAKRDLVEQALFSKISDLFPLPSPEVFVDLSNTLPKSGFSRTSILNYDKTGCKQITLATFLDGAGFIARSQIVDGYVSERKSLQEILEELNVARGATIILDKIAASRPNISWLTAKGFKYIVLNLEHSYGLDLSGAENLLQASEAGLHIEHHTDEQKGVMYLSCQSAQQRAEYEAEIQKCRNILEARLNKIARKIHTSSRRTELAKLTQRIEKLKAKAPVCEQFFRITPSTDPSDGLVYNLNWEFEKNPATIIVEPGGHCIRTDNTSQGAQDLWKTYTMLVDYNAVFRSLKSEPGLYPEAYRQINRADGYLFTTVLAYQAVQVLRRKLMSAGIKDSWASLRATLSVQRRVTSCFTRRDGQTVHIRNATIPEPRLTTLYSILSIPPDPGGIKESIQPPSKVKR